MTLYLQLHQIQLMIPAFELKSSWDVIQVWSRVTMYPGQSQNSLRKNWILKDMIGNQLHQRFKDFYSEEFKKRFHWNTAIEGSVKDHFLKKCSIQYKGMSSEARSSEEKRKNIPKSIWESWKPHYDTEDCKAKSAQCSKNRLSEKCGEGSGPSRHTGGSRTHRENARQLAIVLGRPPHPHELLKKTHTKGNNEFVDLKSKSTHDAVMSKITSASQLVDESGESPTIDFSKAYMDEVGGVKKACIYGLGSQAALRTLVRHLLQLLSLKIVILILE